MNDKSTDVLIVGAGPIGLILTVMFEKLGIKSMVVERREGLHKAPQAHVISSRTMEICRAFGISHELVLARATNPMQTGMVRWVDNLLGRDLGALSIVKSPEQLAVMFSRSPTPVLNLSQDQFEEVLYDHIEDPSQILFNHKWVSLEESDGGYVSQVEDSDGAAVQIRSRYIIGADGAGSRVRAAIGANMEGPQYVQSYMNVHFKADLSEQLKGREGLLYWVMDPEAMGCFIAHDIAGNWIYMKTLNTEDPPKVPDQQQFADLLQKAIGVDDIEPNIQSISSWVMTAQVADRYQRGRVFLAGDAAHRFPPTGGIGMNTGFQDAHNLAWKIASVERGFDASLLDTYESERRAPALANCKQSLHNFRNMSIVDEALDVDNDGVASVDDFERVRADSTLQGAVDAAIEKQAPHFNMVGLDLGVVYESAAVIPDGSKAIEEDPGTQYTPNVRAGGRLPHCWLQRGGEQLSTLDLVEYDHFTVMVFQKPTAGLQNAIAALKDEDYSLSIVDLSADSDIKPTEDRFAGLFPADETLLLRPDGHIAARFKGMPETKELSEAMQRVLGAIAA